MVSIPVINHERICEAAEHVDHDILEFFSKAMDVIMENRNFIMCETYKHRKEVSGMITSDLKHIYKGPGNDTMVEPDTEKCFGSYHSHPPISVLTLPEEDILFNPPSTADIYYAILSRVLERCNHSFVISKEGVYVISPRSNAVECFSNELQTLIASDDPWRMPAEPIHDKDGLQGFDFHGRGDYFPYCNKLLNAKISWDHYDLDSAICKYKEMMADLYVSITFIDSLYTPTD